MKSVILEDIDHNWQDEWTKCTIQHSCQTPTHVVEKLIIDVHQMVKNMYVHQMLKNMYIFGKKLQINDTSVFGKIKNIHIHNDLNYDIYFLFKLVVTTSSQTIQVIF